jgi:histone acetyltransferase
VVKNDHGPESLTIVMKPNRLYNAHLPNMPDEHIASLVFDRTHISIAIVMKPQLEVIGGITYHSFNPR